MPAFNSRGAPARREIETQPLNASLGPLALGLERPRQGLGCPPLVPVVQTADLPYGNHASVLRRVHRPRFGRILSQGEVSSGFVIVTQEQFHMFV